MPDINLLPEDLRENEVKDQSRAAKKPKVFEVELSRPEGSKAKDKSEAGSRPKKSFWSKLFGSPKKKPVVFSKKSSPDSGKPSMPSSDILAKAKKQKIAYHNIKMPPKIKNEDKSKERGKSFWGKLFGPKKPKVAKKVVANMEIPKPIKPSVKPAPPKDRQNIEESWSKMPKKERKKNGWWAAFKGLFEPQEKKPRPPKKIKDRLKSEPIRPSIDLLAPKKEVIKEKPMKMPKNKNGWWQTLKSLLFSSGDKSVPPIKIDLSKKDSGPDPIKQSADLDNRTKELHHEHMLSRPEENEKKSTFSVDKKQTPEPQPKTDPPVAEEKKDHRLQRGPLPAGRQAPEGGGEKKEDHHKDNKKTRYHIAPKGKKSKMHINLIPEELMSERALPNARRRMIALILAIVFPAILIYGVFELISYYQGQMDEAISYRRVRIEELNKTVQDFRKVRKKTVLAQKKMVVTQDVLSQHFYWTKFFKLLEKYTLDSVYYTEFSVDLQGEFALPVLASSYGEAAKQITVFEQADDFIANVEVSDISVNAGSITGIDGVALELKLKLVDGIFVETD